MSTSASKKRIFRKKKDETNLKKYTKEIRLINLFDISLSNYIKVIVRVIKLYKLNTIRNLSLFLSVLISHLYLQHILKHNIICYYIYFFKILNKQIV